MHTFMKNMLQMFTYTKNRAGANYRDAKQNLKRKKKGHPGTGREDPEGEQRYSSTLSLTSALGTGWWSRYAPAALPPGKRPSTHLTKNKEDKDMEL
jgi:hypothetical protein